MSERSDRISKLLKDKRSRDAYIRAKLGILVPAQIKALRLNSEMPRQSDLAEAAEMHQSRISKLETPGAANVTIDTLAWLAAVFQTGLIVKFVPVSEMLKWENDFSVDTFNVCPRLPQDVEFLDPEASEQAINEAIAGTPLDTQVDAIWRALLAGGQKKNPAPADLIEMPKRNKYAAFGNYSS